MLRSCVAALALIVCCCASTTLRAQTPEITIHASSASGLGQVLAGFGQRGEMFGLNGPAAFLSNYGRHIDDQQPLTAALTFTSKTPMFAAEFATKNAAEFLAALDQDGFKLDAKTGELAKADSSLKFFVRQTGNQLRISDNAEFLKNVRWPAAEAFSSSNVVAIAKIDWRNMQPELRSNVAQQAMTIFLPQANPMASLSIDALPDLLSQMAASRVAALFAKSESMAVKFVINEPGKVEVIADVVNRSVVGRPTLPTPFATLGSELAIASMEWNTPIESELRTQTQAWATQLSVVAKQMFANDEIGDPSGLKVLQEGATVLARHCTETIALPNLQGTINALSDGQHPLIVGGIRVANPARLDSDLQKLVKSAIENGAPFQFSANVASGHDLSVHRLQIPIAAELASARELFGETLTIHLATTSHALLVGIGKGSDTVLQEIVSPQSATSPRWLDAVINEKNKELCAKLGLQACQIRVVPANQGFQVMTTLSASKSATQLTSTRNDDQPTPAVGQ